MKRRIGQVDLDTGEVLGEYVTVVTRRKRGSSRESWVALMLKGFSTFKMLKRAEDMRVLFALLEKLDFENLIVANQAKIAKDLGMESAQVNRAIKRLVEAEILTKGPKEGIHGSYRLNPNYGWRGSEENRVRALDDYRAKRTKPTKVTEDTKPEPKL
jgi:predicted transcriptional regulator